jgi:hypothetical protein
MATILSARHIRRPIIALPRLGSSNEPLPIFSALGCDRRFGMTRRRLDAVLLAGGMQLEGGRVPLGPHRAGLVIPEYDMPAAEGSTWSAAARRLLQRIQANIKRGFNAARPPIRIPFPACGRLLPSCSLLWPRGATSQSAAPMVLGDKITCIDAKTDIRDLVGSLMKCAVECTSSLGASPCCGVGD